MLPAFGCARIPGLVLSDTQAAYCACVSDLCVGVRWDDVCHTRTQTIDGAVEPM